MLKEYGKICAVLFVILLQCIFTDLSAFSCVENLETHSLKNVEKDTLTIVTSLKSLYFGENEILLKQDGLFYNVTNLEKQEEQWVAIVAFKGYCQRGHNLCDNCGLCHIKFCPYFVPYCNKWDR